MMMPRTLVKKSQQELKPPFFPALFFEVERLLNAEQSVCQKDDTDDNRDECDYKGHFQR